MHFFYCKFWESDSTYQGRDSSSSLLDVNTTTTFQIQVFSVAALTQKVDRNAVFNFGGDKYLFEKSFQLVKGKGKRRIVYRDVRL